jgi:hypothetical protein
MDNPFKAKNYAGRQTYWITAVDRIARVREFDQAQCEAALRLDDLQRTVERAVRVRLRALQAGG